MRMRAIIATVLTACMCVPPVAAQSRYDKDQAWVRKTIRKQDHHHDHALVIEYDDRVVSRPRRKPRHDYEAPKRREYREPTRVYGYTSRREQFVERDATGHVICFPPIQGISNERTKQEDAWGDAQRDWMNNARWLYGERFIDIRNANPIQKQCNISTVKESVAGKIAQGIKEVVGGDDVGNMWRCVVRAGPCQAPIETDPTIKGEKPQ